MEIPRPRLKALQELDAEEKVAEKAVLAIRRKTLQVDTDLERIREEVETELDRLETHRSELEANMQQLMEEQAMILGALSELEDRQGRHKENLTMLRDEEFEIESERKELNIALKQLRAKQRSLKDMVNKKYAPMDASKMGRRFLASPSAGSSYKQEPRQFISEEPVFQKWRSMGLDAGGAANARAAESSRYPPEAISEEKNAAMELPNSQTQIQIQEESLPAAQANPNPAENNKKKPGILRRIRRAADKFLPEPFRINKPAAALLEEKAGQADSATAVETLSAEGQNSPTDEPANSDLDYAEPQKSPKFDAGEPEFTGAPLVEKEISQFEEKLEALDYEPPKPSAPLKEDLRSRISNIVKSGRGRPQSGTYSPSSGISIRVHGEQEAKERGKVGLLRAASPELLGAPSPEKAPFVERHLHKSVSALNAASMLRRPAAYAESSDRGMQKAKSEIVKKLSTEAKLHRLQTKLQEMKSALKTLSKEDDRPALEEHLRPGKPLFSQPQLIRKISPPAHADRRAKTAGPHSPRTSAKTQQKKAPSMKHKKR